MAKDIKMKPELLDDIEAFQKLISWNTLTKLLDYFNKDIEVHLVDRKL